MENVGTHLGVCLSHVHLVCALHVAPQPPGLASPATFLDLSPSGLTWSSSLSSEFRRLRS